jgi:hypothetical protein
MVAANHMEAIAGQIWACTVAGLALIISLVALMSRLGILKGWAAMRIIFYHSAAITGLTWLAVAVTPAAAEAIPPQNWGLAFEENFRSLRLSDNASDGIWEPQFAWGSHTIRENRELQYYVDPRPRRDEPVITSLAPFRVDKNGLVIRASPIPIPERKFVENLSYASGLSELFVHLRLRRNARSHSEGKRALARFLAAARRQDLAIRNRCHGGSPEHKRISCDGAFAYPREAYASF